MSIQQVSLVGDPDIVACICGQFVALELKSEGGRRSPLQWHKLAKLEKCGGISLTVFPSTWYHTQIILTKISEREYND